MKNYRTRQERNQFLVDNFGDYLKGSVLDVGCDVGYLRSIIGQERYVGIDLFGNPDIKVNLESAGIPLKNASFDCVICLDVLEHLENIHGTFSELIRVSRRHVIVSLPNPFGQYWPLFWRGGGRADKYGLPVTLPKDRHRWFFNYEEARHFLLAASEKHQAAARQIVPVPIPEESVFWKTWIKKAIRRMLAPGGGDRLLNFNTQAVWAVIEKNRSA